jgi:hypothetical protein
MELVEGPDGRWRYKNEPRHCPNGHRFDPGAVFLSSTPGSGLSWQCVVCTAVVTQEMVERMEARAPEIG